MQDLSNIRRVVPPQKLKKNHPQPGVILFGKDRRASTIYHLASTVGKTIALHDPAGSVGKWSMTAAEPRGNPCHDPAGSRGAMAIRSAGSCIDCPLRPDRFCLHVVLGSLSSRWAITSSKSNIGARGDGGRWTEDRCVKRET